MMSLIFSRLSGIIIIMICLLSCLLVVGVSAASTYAVGNHVLQNITTVSYHSVRSAEIEPPGLPSAPPEQPTLPVIPAASVSAAEKVTPDAAVQPLSAVIAVLVCTGMILYLSARR